MNYAAHVGTRKRKPQPATEKVREDQVENNTGGFTFQITIWDKLTRFLILGAEGGTYYVKERDLVKQNHASILACIKADGPRTVREIVDVSVRGRAYKNDPAVFALALCLAHGDAETKTAAREAVTQVCRIGTHLFHFTQFITQLRGTGRGVRNALAMWYQLKEADALAYQAINNQQRDGWSHKDVLRVAHPNMTQTSNQANAVVRWMVGGMDALKAREVKRQKDGSAEKQKSMVRYLPKIIQAFEEAKTASTKDLVKLIVDQDLPREAIPTEKLNELPVWEALLEKMPLTAMIRNLGKMTSIGLVKPLSKAAKKVQETLGNQEALTKARIHPMAVLLAAKTYGSGHGLKGSLSWTAVPAIESALDAAFYKTFGNVKPSGKPMLIALDVSGSMGWDSVAGAPITPAEAVAAFSLIHVSVEPECHVFGFADTFRELGIRKGMTLAQATRAGQRHNFGSTDVSLAVKYHDPE